MLIAHSTFSFASACEGNRSRETLRSWETSHGEGGWYLPENENASPAQANPFRPRYTYLVVVNLPELVKPANYGEAMSTCTHSAARGDRGGRVLKDYRQVPGDPHRCSKTEVVDLQSHWGINNPLNFRLRESERPIVAKKRGNARGAKGPYFSRVSNEERGAA
jgi:hypothetical protein